MFLLYQKKHKVFPETVAIGGKFYAVNADFRNILRINAMLGDCDIPADKKFAKIIEWFYEDDLPENILGGDMTDVFYHFINAGFEPENETEPQFCYNFDAKEIYSDFLREYSIDLTDVNFLHWHKFKILLENLPPESAFKRKIELRFMDLDGLNTAGFRKFRELSEAKEAVQLPEKYDSEDNLQNLDEFNEIWGKAGNI